MCIVEYIHLKSNLFSENMIRTGQAQDLPLQLTTRASTRPAPTADCHFFLTFKPSTYTIMRIP